MHTNWCVLIEISIEIGMLNFWLPLLVTAQTKENYFTEFYNVKLQLKNFNRNILKHSFVKRLCTRLPRPNQKGLVLDHTGNREFLPLLYWKIKRDASQNIFSVFQIAKKCHSNVETGYSDHTGIQYPSWSSKFILVFHLVFNWENNSNTFKCIYGCSKKQW